MRRAKICIPSGGWDSFRWPLDAMIASMTLAHSWRSGLREKRYLAWTYHIQKTFRVFFCRVLMWYIHFLEVDGWWLRIPTLGEFGIIYPSEVMGYAFTTLLCDTSVPLNPDILCHVGRWYRDSDRFFKVRRVGARDVGSGLQISVHCTTTLILKFLSAYGRWKGILEWRNLFPYHLYRLGSVGHAIAVLNHNDGLFGQSA